MATCVAESSMTAARDSVMLGAEAGVAGHELDIGDVGWGTPCSATGRPRTKDVKEQSAARVEEAVAPRSPVDVAAAVPASPAAVVVDVRSRRSVRAWMLVSPVDAMMLLLPLAWAPQSPKALVVTAALMMLPPLRTRGPTGRACT